MLSFLSIRRTLFCFLSFLSLICAGIFSLWAIRSWGALDTLFRALIVSIIAVDAIGAILLIVLLLLKFRLWLDVARFGALLLFQFVNAGFLSFFYNRLPCPNLGHLISCRTVAVAAYVAAWSLPILMLIYVILILSREWTLEPPSLKVQQSSYNRHENTFAKRVSTSTSGSDALLWDKNEDGVTPQLPPPLYRVPVDSETVAPRKISRNSSTRSLFDDVQFGFYRPGSPESLYDATPSSVSSQRSSFLSSLDRQNTNNSRNTLRLPESNLQKVMKSTRKHGPSMYSISSYYMYEGSMKPSALPEHEPWYGGLVGRRDNE